MEVPERRQGTEKSPEGGKIERPLAGAQGSRLPKRRSGFRGILGGVVRE